ncbi:MAG: hypothetical protein ACHBN1_24735 [Heteroscytonema crispum UTEX LB 1556]
MGKGIRATGVGRRVWGDNYQQRDRASPVANLRETLPLGAPSPTTNYAPGRLGGWAAGRLLTTNYQQRDRASPVANLRETLPLGAPSPTTNWAPPNFLKLISCFEL